MNVTKTQQLVLLVGALPLMLAFQCNGKVSVDCDTATGDCSGTVTQDDTGDPGDTGPTIVTETVDAGGNVLSGGWDYEVAVIENGTSTEACFSNVVKNGNAGQVVCVEAGAATGGDATYDPSADLTRTVNGWGNDLYCGIGLGFLNNEDAFGISCEGDVAGAWQGSYWYKNTTGFLSSSGTNDVAVLMSDILFDGTSLAANSFFGKCLQVDYNLDGNPDVMCTKTGNGGMAYFFEGAGVPFSGVYDQANANETVSIGGDGYPGFSPAFNGTHVAFGNYRANSQKGRVDFFVAPVTTGSPTDKILEGAANGDWYGDSVIAVDGTQGAPLAVGVPGKDRLVLVDPSSNYATSNINGDSGSNLGVDSSTCRGHDGKDYLVVGANRLVNSKGNTTGGMIIFQVTSGDVEETPVAIWYGDDSQNGCGFRVDCGADGTSTVLAMTCLPVGDLYGQGTAVTTAWNGSPY